MILFGAKNRIARAEEHFFQDILISNKLLHYPSHLHQLQSPRSGLVPCLRNSSQNSTKSLKSSAEKSKNRNKIYGYTQMNNSSFLIDICFSYFYRFEANKIITNQ